MAKIGFIGMGNMGYAMLKGALAAFSPSDIIFSSPDRGKCERISSETGVRFAESNAECGNNAKYIVLAVKPQMYPTVLKNIVNVVTEESVIISIAPGITIASIKNALGSNIRVVRAMPNTPALIGEGMTGVAYNASDYSFDERDVIDKFFTSFGKVVYVEMMHIRWLPRLSLVRQRWCLSQENTRQYLKIKCVRLVEQQFRLFLHLKRMVSEMHLSKQLTPAMINVQTLSNIFI